MIILILLLLLVAGTCSAGASERAVADAGNERSQLELNAGKIDSGDPKLPTSAIRVPMTRQSHDYTCGVAALQSVLAYYGKEYREDELSKALRCNSKNGTAYQEIARFARDKNFEVEVIKGMKLDSLKSNLEKERPVICLIQAWPEASVDYSKDWNDGHYVVAIGFDTSNLYFMDPSTLGNYTYIPIPEFLTRWHDTDGKERLQNFAMIVSRNQSHYDPDTVKKLE